MKKIVLYGVGVLAILVALVFLLRNWILKTTVEAAVSGLTGFKTDIEVFRYDFPATLEIRELTIRNPGRFENKIFAKIPEVYIDLSLSELLRRERLHLRGMKLRIQEIHIEKNSQGITNIALLRSAGGGDAQNKEAPSEKSTQPAPTMPFLLERLELTLRNVSFEDRSPAKLAPSAVVPDRISVDLKVEKEIFENIRSPQVLLSLILLKIVQGTTFGNLLGLSPDKLKDSLTQALGSGREIFGETTGQVGEQTGDLVSQVVGTKNKLRDKAGDAREQVLGLFAKLKSNKDE